MKPAILILISLILHVVVLGFAPRREDGEAVRKPGSPAVSFLGELSDDIFPPRDREAVEKSIPDYPGFRPPDAEADVIEPPAFAYEAGWAPPAPGLAADEIAAFSEESMLVEEINIFESYLGAFTVEPIPCPERILP